MVEKKLASRGGGGCGHGRDNVTFTNKGQGYSEEEVEGPGSMHVRAWRDVCLGLNEACREALSEMGQINWRN